MRITAAIAAAPHAPFTLGELEIDDPRDDEVLVRVVACGGIRGNSTIGILLEWVAPE